MQYAALREEFTKQQRSELWHGRETARFVCFVPVIGQPLAEFVCEDVWADRPEDALALARGGLLLRLRS